MRIARGLSVLSCLLLMPAAALAGIVTEWVEYRQGDKVLKGYLAFDEAVKEKRPAVLLVHRRDGMTELTKRNTELIAQQGYVVFAADIFGYGYGVLPKAVPEMIEQSRIYNSDRPLMVARAKAAYDVIAADPRVDASRIAVVGYCFGGTAGVELAEAGAALVGTVAIHGTFRNFTAGAARNIKGRVLILHGAEDTTAPLSEVNALIKDLREARVPWQMELYSGANHGFSTPKGPDEEFANAQSMAATARFLATVFKR
jgi:dienelactone hydrolase